MMTSRTTAYDNKMPHNDDDRSSTVVNEIQDLENHNDGVINKHVPQQQKQRQLRRFERRHMAYFSLAFAFIVTLMVAFVQQNYSSSQYKSKKVKYIEKIGQVKVSKRITSQKENNQNNQKSKDHTEFKHKIWPTFDSFEESITKQHSKDGYFEYDDDEEPDPELLNNSWDKYHTKEFLAGRLKRRILKSPPLSTMTHRQRRNASTTTTERIWSFNITQRNLHLHHDKPNVYCVQDGDDSHGHLSENNNGLCSWFMVNEYIDTSHLPPSQIIAWKAHVTRHLKIFPTSPDNAIVHHMNIIPCSKDIDKTNPPLTYNEPWGFMEGDGPCDQIFFAYDRGSFVGYEMPDNVGIRIGKGTPHERLLIQWHYLLPPCYDDSHETRSCPSPYTGGIQFEEAEDGVVVDESGFEILVTPDLRPYDSATIGVIDPYMLIDYGADNFLYSFESNVKRMNEILAHDLETYGGALTPFANHLHQHDHGTQMWTSHLRNGEKIGEYGRFMDYGGGVNSTVERLGVGETFMDILPGQQDSRATPNLDDRFVVLNANNNDREMMITSHMFMKGDTLRTNCVMDTKHKNIWHARTNTPVKYGLFTGEEMCGTLLMYYPHDATKRFTPGAILANEEDASTRRTCFDWKSSSPSSLTSGITQGGTCEMPHGNHDDYERDVKLRNQYFQSDRQEYSGGTPHFSPGQICDGMSVDVDGRRVLDDEAEGSTAATEMCDP